MHINGNLTSFQVAYHSTGRELKAMLAKDLLNSTFYYTITGLRPASSYSIKIYALNHDGMSPASDSLAARTVSSNSQGKNCLIQFVS